MKKEALAFLGLLNKAGKTVFGEGIEKAMSSGEALILAYSSSKQSARIKTKAKSKGLLLLEGVSQEELGEALGRERLSAVLIQDKKASLALAAKWNKEGKEPI